MRKMDIVSLITETRSAHGVHEPITEDGREVYAEIRSATRSEFYNALNAGVQPEYIIALTLAEDYEGERYLRYQGQKYRIVRSYLTPDGGVELTVERGDVNGED